MPPVDVDVSNIPDMIEAQLTLSYSRLAHLVRLIVDQGNGHDVDIDKLTARINALTTENAELRDMLASLQEEKSQSIDLRGELDVLRQEVSRLSGACAENSKQLFTLAEETAQQIGNLESRLTTESQNRASSTEEIQVDIKELQEFTHGVERRMSLLHRFAVLWESQDEKVESLTSCGPDGNFCHTSAERTAYLHSLPAFVALLDELEVLRQMVRQHASDALSAKSVAGPLRRTGSVEAALSSGGNGAASFDRQLLEGFQASLREVNMRIEKLENRAAPSGERPERKHQWKQPVDSPAKDDDLAGLNNRLQHVENRLHNLVFDASEGNGVETASHINLEERLRSLEEVVGVISQSKATQEQRNGEGGPSSTTPMQRPSLINQHSMGRFPATSVGNTPMLAENGTLSTTPNEGAALPSLDARHTQRSTDGKPYVSMHQNTQFLNDANVIMHHNPSEMTPTTPQSLPHVNAVGQDGGVFLRIAQLEENTALLKAKKADRRELAQLEDALRHILQNQVVSPSSALMRGMVPHRPMSQGDTRVAYSADSAHRSAGPPHSAGTPPVRPMFLGGSSHHLRDTAGTMTPATVAVHHQR